MSGNWRPPSSTDVARAAGVSQSAVSRAFTPGARIAEATRARILEAAEALGYRPNLLPKILQTNRSGIVAVVVGGFYNPYFAMTLEAFSKALTAAGRQMMLVRVDSDRILDGVVDQLAGYRVDAVVSALALTSQAAADQLSKLRIPIVTLNSDLAGDWIRSVSSDNFAAGVAAARLLRERGGTRFGFVAGPADSPAQVAREAGFAHGLAELGMASAMRAGGGYDYASGARAARDLFSGGERPDALFCANDLAAFGVIDVLREDFGLGAPGEVLLVGYDNLDMAAWAPYRLTSFDQDIQAHVAAAMELLDLEAGATCVARVVPSRLVERESTLRS
ncbi:LacI family DNA-binding transcriptional regulator [Caulobacter endophyticus]|uniref:LacI family DNA-binding transcriptional regulator n=1 Tax=Caulobacter endophyticus TaxID=2172652 RepID=UPI0024105F08|nr:LacI family DNA-binding transcriptional regulator [Caulobacter endophyticus]MDG2528901.1 LacI family DNA-binding transcriptional regulator [Caulobacter endophyticus]